MIFRRVEQEEETQVPGVDSVARTFVLAIITGIGIGLGFLIMHKPKTQGK